MSRRPIRMILAVLLPLLLIASACSSDPDESASTDSSLPSVKIGIQDFPESKVLANLYGEALAQEGFDVSYKELGGYRDILYKSFESGDVNFTLDYASSALEFLNKQAGQASPDIEKVMPLLSGELAKLKLQALDPAKAVDSNAFVVTKETAESKNLHSLSDLTSDLRLGGFADCPTNPFCIPGIKSLYGIDLSAKFIAQDGGDLTKTALKGNEIDVAVLTTTDPAIAENGWVILTDDKGLINADNIVPVLTDKLATDAGAKLKDLVNKISAALTTEDLTELNRQYVVDKDDADTVASGWLRDNDFL
ncbi:MAG: ABC transporter substrate-binding protein [Microthrixaceae bacterium]